jgi:hypothetical protein
VLICQKKFIEEVRMKEKPKDNAVNIAHTINHHVEAIVSSASRVVDSDYSRSALASLRVRITGATPVISSQMIRLAESTPRVSEPVQITQTMGELTKTAVSLSSMAARIAERDRPVSSAMMTIASQITNFASSMIHITSLNCSVASTATRLAIVGQKFDRAAK